VAIAWWLQDQAGLLAPSLLGAHASCGALRQDSDEAAVDDVRQGNPAQFHLIDLHGELLAPLLQRARPESHVTVPFPVAVYDANIGDAGNG